MLFTGLSEHTIDAKGRLAIPAKYRNQWSTERDGEAWYCIPWPPGYLRIYTEAMFTQLATQGENTLTPGTLEADLETALFSSAERLELDSAGRLMIPRTHLDLTKLGTDVVIVGARNRLEVRDKAQWLAGGAERFNQLPDLVRKVGQSKQ